MDVDQSRVQELVANPTESLNIELKRWLDPREPVGKSKIVQACLALRNYNGGFLVIGFDDKTRKPDLRNEASNPQVVFHVDAVQGLVSKFASTIFEIGVGFGERNGILYPVIEVPSGVKTPVIAKSDLFDATGKNKLIRVGDFWVRTLLANGTPSTARASPQDWGSVIEICFENREADIGRFLRRHFPGGVGLIGGGPPSPTLKERAQTALDDGHRRFAIALSARNLGSDKEAAAKGGTWSVALVIDPPHPDALPDQAFLNTLASNNPNLTGWPVWMDTRGFADREAAPKVVDGAWQSLIVSLDDNSWRHLDFFKFDPRGEFFLLRVLQEDLTKKIAPHTALDPGLMTLRIAEAIAVGLTFTKALGWNVSETKLGFAFRWTNLRGRELNAWANPERFIVPGFVAHDDEVTAFLEVPADTPVSAIAPLVNEATRDLFVRFNGYTMRMDVIEHWVQRLIERKL